MEEEYARQMIAEIYQTSRDKNTSAHFHKLIIFMMQYHSTRMTTIMKKARLTDNEIKSAYDHFDAKAVNIFDKPNLRNLPQLHEAQRNYTEVEDEEDEVDNDEYENYDEQRSTYGERESS
eukprot:2660656-Amphidinium_carterae.1